MSTLQDWSIDNFDSIPADLIDKEIKFDEWYGTDKYGDTSGWLNKPQFRILSVETEQGLVYLVFDETEYRIYSGKFTHLDLAIQHGESII